MVLFFLQDSKCFLHTNSPMASPSSRTDPVKIRSTATTTLCELVSPTVSWKLASRCRSMPLSPPRAITETGKRWSGYVTHFWGVWLHHIYWGHLVWSCHTFFYRLVMSNVFFLSGHVTFFVVGLITSYIWVFSVWSCHIVFLFGCVTLVLGWSCHTCFFVWSCHFLFVWWHVFFGLFFGLVMSNFCFVFGELQKRSTVTF